ncbi:sulfurtransferase TusA family protein [Falsibacillus albus]|uniref:Rhodanese domain-containing protein n=1 Tax=Falsibacillus albus TaxID=2478915 RepID=A0A3L7K2N8_9BACI|nr:sulfurtransferase TusA family protein [Falsibacillus albus]RLQ96885.1 hypothetical protein D9X91_06305 [Falsibacillus albus]
MIKTDLTLDAKGLACPMPIVKTRKSMNEIEAGQVLEVLATDKGSKADMAAWAESSGHQYLGTIEEGELLKHYIRKASNSEEAVEKKFEMTIDNEELANKLNDDAIIVDVREPAEYSFGHIPGAVSIPLGEIEARAEELDDSKEIFVVCRTGSRSDFACQKLQSKGFKKIYNVVPGMSKWDGPLENQ